MFNLYILCWIYLLLKISQCYNILELSAKQIVRLWYRRKCKSTEFSILMLKEILNLTENKFTGNFLPANSLFFTEFLCEVIHDT